MSNFSVRIGSARSFATASLRLAQPSRFSGVILPLDFFVNRAKSLSLYRAFIRASRGFGDAGARRETVSWIRGDFERYRNLIDSEKSKTLLALGNRQLKQMNSTGMLLGPEGSKFRGGRSKTDY